MVFKHFNKEVLLISQVFTLFWPTPVFHAEAEADKFCLCVWKRSVSLMRKMVLTMKWLVRKSRRKQRSIRARQSEGFTMRTVATNVFCLSFGCSFCYCLFNYASVCQVLLTNSHSCTPVRTVPAVTSVRRRWRTTLNYAMKRARTTTAAPSVAIPSPTAHSLSVTWPHTGTSGSRYSAALTPSRSSHLCGGNHTELLFSHMLTQTLSNNCLFLSLSFLSGLFLSQAETESSSVQNAPRPSNTNIIWRSTYAYTAVSEVQKLFWQWIRKPS